jgi:monoamine oxidase
LLEPVAPSATQSVPGRFWCYTELDQDGNPRPVLGALATSDSGLLAQGLDDLADRWLDAIEELRPDLRLDRSTVLIATWHDQPWTKAVQVARSLACPPDDEALARPFGRLSFAGEHTAGDSHGSMEGAILSGQRAAGHALATVQDASANSPKAQ